MEKLVDFYTNYFKVFPNFIILNEKEFMYKNIERKQRFIDERQHAYEKYKKASLDKNLSKTKLFNSFYYKDASIFR